jgi:hypothetical protein
MSDTISWAQARRSNSLILTLRSINTWRLPWRRVLTHRCSTHHRSTSWLRSGSLLYVSEGWLVLRKTPRWKTLWSAVARTRSSTSVGSSRTISYCRPTIEPYQGYTARSLPNSPSTPRTPTARNWFCFCEYANRRGCGPLYLSTWWFWCGSSLSNRCQRNRPPKNFYL